MGPDGAYKVGNGVTPPAVLTRAGPEIPDLARRLRAQGEVLVSIVVQSNGSLRDIHIAKSAGYGMDEKAVEAVRKWRFKAGTRAGAAVDVRVNVEVGFRLEPEPKMWGAGPLRFDVEKGVIPPVLQSGTMPKAIRETGDEAVLLRFTVSREGEVSDIRPLDGEKSKAVTALIGSLSTWRFTPASNGSGPLPASGKVLFIKGEDQYRYQVSTAFRDSGSLRPQEQTPASSSLASGTTGPSRIITVYPKLRMEPDEAQKLLLERVAPRYPDAAKAAGVQGAVLLAVTIGEDGRVKDVQEISGPRELIPAAAEAVKRWRYQPTVLRGRTWEVITEVEIQFRLPE